MRLLTALLIMALYVPMIFVCRDLNVEALSTALVVGYGEQAKGNVLDYFEHDKKFEQYKREDKEGAFQAYKGQFLLSYQVLVNPTATLLMLPLVKAFGVKAWVVVGFSVFFCLMSLLVFYWYVHNLYDGNTAWVSTWMVGSSLLFLITTATAYPNFCMSFFFLISMLLCLVNRWNVLAGVAFGLLCGIGWVVPVFGVGLFFLSLWMNGVDRIRCFFRFCVAGGVTIMALLLAMSFYYHCTLDQTMGGWLWPIFYRSSESPIGGFEYAGFREKLVYFVDCFFLGSNQLDHCDKYLEKHWMIDPFVLVLFLYGLLYGRRDRPWKFLFGWIVVGVAFVVTYGYAHRYAILFAPAVMIMAAEVIVGSKRAVAIILLAVMLVSGGYSAKLFYVDYLCHKQANLNIDRFRGFSDMTKFLERYDKDCLVVLSDPFMMSPVNFQFYTWGKDFSHVYWNVVSKDFNSPDDIVAWENKQLEKYRTIVYLCSTEMVRDEKTALRVRVNNMLVYVHPNDGIPFSYRYGNNKVSIFAIVARRRKI